MGYERRCRRTQRRKHRKWKFERSKLMMVAGKKIHRPGLAPTIKFEVVEDGKRIKIDD